MIRDDLAVNISALEALTGNSEWCYSPDEGSDVDNNIFDITHVKYPKEYKGVRPTSSEISIKANTLWSEFMMLQYTRDRQETYPSIEDQLDELYHSGIEGWKLTIQAIKAKYPKPEEAE